MFRRIKYGYSFRLRCVREVVEKGCSIYELAKKTGVMESNIRSWVRTYELKGKEGLRSGERRTYSEKFKVEVVLAVKRERLSLNDACSKFNVRNECTLTRWIQDYNRQGIEGVKSKPKGRPPNMKKPIKRKPRKKSAPLTREEELLRENEYLRAENELLKKLQALVQSKKK